MNMIAWILANCKFAMPAPSAQMQAQPFYHGTPEESAAQQIMQQGLIIPPDLKDRKGFLKPVAGKVYLTPNISYALIYALGANMAGSEFPADWYAKKGRYGYVFQMNGADLQDVQPDEDSVGEMLYEQKGPYWLKNLAERIVAPSRMKAVMSGEYIYFASVGKQLIRAMSPAQLSELMALGGHVAHTGSVKPMAAWRVDKTRSQEFSKDGSNFFQVAEKIL